MPRSVIAWFFALCGILSFSAFPSFAETRSNAPVTQQQFKQWTNWMKKSVDVLNRRQKRLEREESSHNQTSQGEVDLSKLDMSTGQSPSGEKGASYSHETGPAQPMFKTFFDFNLVDRPGYENLSFNNYHHFLFFELIPTSTVQFTFDVNPSPYFYELDYQATPRLTLRVGKIFIPFDDISSQSPHNIFGGRVGISRLSPDPNQQFLPDVWADLGVGAKYVFIDASNLLLEGHLVVVNGFFQGLNDPNPADAAGTPYPSFNGITQNLQPDNNRDKSIGLRGHVLLANRLGIGVSYFTGRWSNDSVASARINAVGLDSQLRLSWAELRIGLAAMSVGLVDGNSFKRGGTYAEIGHRFGPKDRWKVLGRAGTLNLDNRVNAVTDQTIVGGTILYRPGFVEFSLEHSRDLNDNVAKPNHSFTDLRMVMAF
jgi:hypothetical protein